jgi:hypothetical protein
VSAVRFLLRSPSCFHDPSWTAGWPPSRPRSGANAATTRRPKNLHDLTEEESAGTKPHLVHNARRPIARETRKNRAGILPVSHDADEGQESNSSAQTKWQKVAENGRSTSNGTTTSAVLRHWERPWQRLAENGRSTGDDRRSEPRIDANRNTSLFYTSLSARPRPACPAGATV